MSLSLDQKIENIRGFIISILFWIIVLFVTNVYAKYIGIFFCFLLFSSRYWEFLVNLVKKEKEGAKEAEFDTNTLPLSAKDGIENQIEFKSEKID